MVHYLLASVSIVEYKINTRPSAAPFVCEIVFCEIVFCCILRDCILLLRQLGTPLFYFEFVTTLFLSFVILYRQLGVILYQLVTPQLPFYSIVNSSPPHSSIPYIANLAPLHYPLTLLFCISPTWRPFTTLFQSLLLLYIYRQLRTPLSYPQCSTPLITLVTHTTSRHYHYCK